MGFGGPGGQGPICLGGQGDKQYLSRPDSRSAELRVFRGQGETKGEKSGVGRWDRPCRQTVWAAEELAGTGPSLMRAAVGEAGTADYF